MTQLIDRPVEDVFNAVIHVENFPNWSPQNPSARRRSDGEIRNGSRFDMEIKGFGVVLQELQEFEPNRRERIVPHIKMLDGGHRFTLTDVGGKTRVDHELEMRPKGVYQLMTPVIWFIGKKNRQATAEALKTYLEKDPTFR